MALYLVLAVLLSPLQAPPQMPVTEKDGFRFRVVRVVFDETAMGFVPADLDPASRVMLVELELLSGRRDAFKDLKIRAAYGQGAGTGAIILIAEGMVKMLSTVTMAGRSSDFRPGADNIVWAFVVPRDGADINLEFPSGETLDLSPHIK